MISTTDKSSIASHFETQAHLGNDTQRRKSRTSTKSTTDAQSSWFKRAAGVATFGLLAAEGAYGRALSSPKEAFTGHARALLQDCPPDAPAMGTGDTSWLTNAGPYVNAVAGFQSWVPLEFEACPTASSIELSYAFNTSGDAVLRDEIFGAGALDAATQSVLLRDFSKITGFVGLTFTPYDNSTTDWPNLAVLRNTDANTTIKHWYAEVPGAVDGVMSHVVYTEPAGIASAAERLAGLSYTLGLKGIGGVSVSGAGLPVGHFGDTALSSVTASKDNACWPASRLGPLDLAFLAARHGLSPLLPQIEVIELDATYGSGGLLLSPDGFTTLAAVHPGQVTISLQDDGSSATRIGDSVILLAPSSLAAGADASDTQGAWIIGNDANNVLFGSPFDDFFSPGANVSVITLGLGADSVLLDDTVNSSVALQDFDPLTDSIWVTPNAARTGQPATQITLGDSANGATLTTAGGASVSLRNLTAADLPDLKSWVFSGVPDTLEPFKFDLCQGVASVPAPAPSMQATVPATSPISAPAPVPASAPTAGPVPAPGPLLTPTPITTPVASAPDSAEGTASSGTPQTEHHGSSHGGTIAGGIIGGVAGVAVLGTLGWCYSQRRRIASNRAQPHNRFQRFEDNADRRGIELMSTQPRAAFGR